MILKQTLLACVTTFLFVVGCTSPIDYPDDIRELLNKSKENRKQLEKTIAHYSKHPEDSLKLQAAYYIIRNMVGLKTLDTNSVSENNVYFDALQAVMQKEGRKKLRSVEIALIIDSINKAKNLVTSVPTAKYLNDLDVISAEFLIHNIDNAFLMWQSKEWSKHIVFADFCEYILPYRCSKEYPQTHIRLYFINKYKNLLDSMKSTNNPFDISQLVLKDVDSYFVEDLSLFKRYYYLRPTKFSNKLASGIGTCYDATTFKITVLRSLGVPAVMDQVPNWGNAGSAHYWCKIIDPMHDTSKTLITNANYPINTQNIISGSSYDLLKSNPTPSIIPKGVQKHYVRTIPKVYRECFSRQMNSLGAIRDINDAIAPYFLNANLKDVTHEYLKTADVNLTLTQLSPNEKYIYLCVFNHSNNIWVPVAWSFLKNNKVRFNNIGKNIVYLPAYYNQNKIIPAANPFLLNLDGEIEQIKPNKNKETIRLHTKYPYRIFVEDWQNHITGSRFQFANKADFSDSITVHTVKHIPFYQTEVPVKTTKKYRYLLCRYSGLGDKALALMSIGELAFIGKNRGGKDVVLAGKLIGDSGDYTHEVNQIIDGKRDNYFRNNRDSINYIGIDLGEGNAQKVSKIKFLARNDDNGVVENVKFELFYWNNEWQSLGFAIGDKNKTATFKNVPVNALFLLENTEGGTENRIFTYKNGTQLFW
jgi:hypothetical protein